MIHVFEKKMIKNLCIVFACLLIAGAVQADIVPLDLPSNGTNLPSGSTINTAGVMHSSGATFDISYTLSAMGNDAMGTLAVAAIEGAGGSFGVASGADGATNGQQRSLDGNDEEELTLAGLGISNFSPGTSGLTASDFTIEFVSLLILNGQSPPDGANFIVDGGAVQNIGPLTPQVDSLVTLSQSGSSVFIEADDDALVTTDLVFRGFQSRYLLLQFLSQVHSA